MAASASAETPAGPAATTEPTAAPSTKTSKAPAPSSGKKPMTGSESKSAHSSSSSAASAGASPAAFSPARSKSKLSLAGAANSLTAAMKFNVGRSSIGDEPKTTLLSAKVWDIYTLPPSNTIKGKVVPRVINRYAHRRKVSLEVHRVTPAVVPDEEDEPSSKDGTEKTNDEKKDDGNQTAEIQEKRKQKEHSYEECVVRVLVPINKEVEKAAQKAGQDIRKGAKPEQVSQQLQEASIRAAGSGTVEPLDDESTVAVDPEGALKDTGGKQFIGWKAKYRVPIPFITVKHQQKQSVFVLIETGKIKQERELLFDSYGDARDFVQELESQRQMEEERTDNRLHSAIGDIQLKKNETLDLLVEIVSGWDLPIGDITTSDPYVVCKMGRKELHKTKHISGTLDPIWTIKTGSLFLWHVSAKELFLEEGMTCFVKDYDALGKNETLGVCAIPPKKIYLAQGERMEFKLKNPPGHRGLEDVPGYLAIRVRRATEHDKQFMKQFLSSTKVTPVAEHPKSNNNAIKSIVTKYQKVEDGIRKYKVRPKPDPSNKEAPEWLSDTEIQKETMKESRHWVDAGSGSLGQLHVEVLGCDDLPNLDMGGFTGNKTDAFVSLVFEDCAVRTDVIDDCLSPRWLPWTQRAFIFQIYHPSSQLLLGVFDFDAGIDDHDLIGRVSVDIANMHRDTEYVLTYNIYPSARVSGREAQGTITLRLRLEINEERKAVLAALQPPPPIYVNTAKKKDFRVIRSTCLGSTDVDQYSMKTISSYVDELKEYQYILFYLEDSIITLLLWRGHFEVKIKSKSFMLPIHSLVAFLFAVFLVERPQLVPSFFFASIAWVLLAVSGWRSNTKNVWMKTKTYQEMFEALVLGNSKSQPDSYPPFYQYDAVKSDMEVWQQRIKESEKRAEEAYKEAQEAEKERLKELEEIGDEDTDIGTKTGGGLSIDPIRAALFPVQQILGLVLLKLRFVKNVVIWEECYFSFWITTACIILSIACMFVPWFFLIRWTSRIVVWVVFGPWMKLVDVYYVSKIKPETEEEKKKRKAQEKLQRKLATTEAASRAREKREDAAKLKQIKKFMFGKFSMRIPILKEDRYADRPLPQSTATPYKLQSMTLAELAMREAGYNRTRLPGQNLVGHMIPVPETENFTAAPVGKATAKPEQLAREAPGSDQQSGTESTTMVYAKLGSAVAVAGTVTWFAVPLMAGLAEKAIEAVA